MSTNIDSILQTLGSPISVYEACLTGLSVNEIRSVVSMNPHLTLDHFLIKSSLHSERFITNPNYVPTGDVMILFVFDTVHSQIIVHFNFNSIRCYPFNLVSITELSPNAVFVNCSSAKLPDNVICAGSLPDISFIRRDPLINVPIFINDFGGAQSSLIGRTGIPSSSVSQNFQHSLSAFYFHSKLVPDVTAVTVEWKEVPFIIFNGNISSHDCKGRWINICNKHNIKYQLKVSSMGPPHKPVFTTMSVFNIYGNDYSFSASAATLAKSEEIATEKSLAFVAINYGYQTNTLKSQIIRNLAERGQGITPTETCTTFNQMSRCQLKILSFVFSSTATTMALAKERAYFSLSVRLEEIIRMINKGIQ